MASGSQTSRVSVEQLTKLLDFLENHGDLALGLCRSKEGRQRNKRLWDEVASTLNCIGDGAIKDGAGWSKYWTIFKNRLKNKIRTDRAARHQTGGGPPNIVFTPLEERTMGIIGNDAGAPLSGVQVNPFGTQETGVVDEEIPLLEIQDQENIDLNVDNDMECLIEDVNLSHSQHLEPEPGPSTAPVTCPPPTASVPSARPGPIRRQRTRPRLHSVSEARADILRLEEARIAAEASHAEALQQIASALRAIAECLSGLTAELRQQHQM